LFIVERLLTELLCSAWHNCSWENRRNSIMPGAYNNMGIWETEASLQQARKVPQVLRNALSLPNVRHASGRSERSAISAGTEYSLWQDPDLEDKL
jgi:hypothetical protein